MSVWTLENLCIRALAPKYGRSVNGQFLPLFLKEKLRKLRQQMDIFERAHSDMLDPKEGLPLMLTEDGKLDWMSVVAYCIERYLIDRDDEEKAALAFRIAAINGLESKCIEIWSHLHINTRRHFLEGVNIKVVKYAAWRICRYGVPYHGYQYHDACQEASKMGWHYALQQWMPRIPESEYDDVCGRLVLHAILNDNYHLLHVLPLNGVSNNFHLFFPDGRISDFLVKLADAPLEWQRFTMELGRALLDWVPELDVIRARRELGNNEKTACYVSYIDLLLDSSTKSNSLP